MQYMMQHSFMMGLMNSPSSYQPPLMMMIAPQQQQQQQQTQDLPSQPPPMMIPIQPRLPAATPTTPTLGRRIVCCDHCSARHLFNLNPKGMASHRVCDKAELPDKCDVCGGGLVRASPVPPEDVFPCKVACVY